MKRQSKFSTALFQIAAVVFLLSTTSAYGACCFELGERDAVTVAPCHTPEEDDAAESHGDCCLMCAPMASSHISLVKVFQTSSEVSLLGNESLAWNGIDPPFRPPINLLS